MKLYCKRCGNAWEYHGKAIYYASCSRCKNSIRIRTEASDAADA